MGHFFKQKQSSLLFPVVIAVKRGKFSIFLSSYFTTIYFSSKELKIQPPSLGKTL